MSAIFKNIKMVGVGKGGTKLVERLTGTVFSSMPALAISTNQADLEELKIREKILIPREAKSTKEQVIKIRKSIHSYTCVLIFAQFGDDNSAHLAPAMANIASDMNIESLAICSISKKLDKYASVSVQKLKQHCKHILWLSSDMTISEIFSQNEILSSLAFLSDIEKQNALPAQEESPAEHRSFIDKIIGRKPKKPEVLNAQEVLTQDEFGFNTLSEQRGFFQHTPRNMYNGIDLDVPTYLRKNLKIHL
ncbi:MAG: hypothetical protein R3Y46_05820 [Opitutales bacterium]